MERHIACIVSVEEMAERVQDDDISTYDIPDPEMNTEAMAIENMELAILKNCMEELDAEDREFLLACFESERGSVAELTKVYIFINRNIDYMVVQNPCKGNLK